MVPEVIRQRLIKAVNDLYSGNPSLYTNWRGTGDGLAPQVSQLPQAPCVAVVQYARYCDPDDALLTSLLNVVLREQGELAEEFGVKTAARLNLEQIGNALVQEHDQQFAQLIRALLWTVDAECNRRRAVQQRSLGSEDDRFAHVAFVSLKHAAACYDSAWRLSSRKITGKGKDPKVRDGSVLDFLLCSREVMNDVTYSTWNILWRLLSALRPDDDPDDLVWNSNADDSRTNRLTLLFFEERSARGVLGPVDLQPILTGYDAVVPDPLGFGVTVLDASLQQSLRAAFRCCRTELLSTDASHFPSLHIVPALPQEAQSFAVLEGASAGGLLAAGMILTARGERVDRWRTTTCSLTP
ncbi:MAG: hypothetical protein KDA92_21565, partial [Planctomycetales bacterium]|nr:hypothetical protein [Planctomycetales bacterium]